MSEENTDKVLNIFESKKLPSFIGSENFVEWVKNNFYKIDSSKEIIETKSLAPAKEELIQVVCNYFDLEKDDILIPRRGTFNEPRNIAIYLVR
jgi:chromosomal replication initiation ATPase DnaA